MNLSASSWTVLEWSSVLGGAVVALRGLSGEVSSLCRLKLADSAAFVIVLLEVPHFWVMPAFSEGLSFSSSFSNRRRIS